MHPGYFFFLKEWIQGAEAKALKSDGSRNQITATEHEPAVNGREKMVGCDVRYTDMQGKIQGALEHLQEGTRESRPRMGTGHQQQH